MLQFAQVARKKAAFWVTTKGQVTVGHSVLPIVAVALLAGSVAPKLKPCNVMGLEVAPDVGEVAGVTDVSLGALYENPLSPVTD